MAHHISAKKRIRQTETRTAVNRARKSRVHTFLTKVDESILAGDSTKARDALRAAESEMMRAVTKGIIKLGKASRKVSRLSARIKALGA